jgi:uncharacterized protein YcfJ
MKKLLTLSLTLVMALCFAATANASGGHGRGHYKHKHRKEIVHYYVPVAPAAPVAVVPAAPPGYYAVPAPVPQPRSYYPQQDRRTTQGLAGGELGSALGYQVGNGSPLTTGVGAAAGAYIGNEIAK